jgi:aldose 1-epimerase
VTGTNKTVDVSRFGVLPDGRAVQATTMRNNTGMMVEILDYGAIVRVIEVPDRHGSSSNVVLGFDDLETYLEKSPYFGAIIGRFANRIARGRFELDGEVYQLAINETPNHLHGGDSGFDKKLWTSEVVVDEGSQEVRLNYRSPDGEEGFPGALDTTVRYYLLDDENTLQIIYRAETDKPTVVNLTNHSYFNLAGEGAGSVEGHLLEINADHFLELNDELTPTGEYAEVRGTPMDFTSPHPIGERIREGTRQLVLGNGYDHSYVLNRAPEQTGVAFAARAVDPSSGRVLEVWTTEPGLDVYTGNFLDGSLVGPSGRSYRQGDAFALEPEHLADSPNLPQFPTTVLRPGELYSSTTEFRFGV